jgi:hypothetical protein
MEGIGGAVSASGITNIDAKFPEERWINAGRLYVVGAKLGDKIGMEVVDKDGIVSPAGTVLNTFAKDLFINPESVFQLDYESPYVARLYSFLYIRIKYNAIDADTRHVYLNVVGHIPEPTA